MSQWFRRLADVPNVDYSGSPGVERSRLAGHNATATLNRFTFDGKQHENLTWKTREGETSACPASQWQATPRPGETPAQTALRQVYERVELPGDLSSYHFVIQQAIGELWRFRTQEPWVLEEIEKLCWLDIRLITRSVKEFQRDDGSLLTIYAFDRLLTLFEREGYLHEALQLAEFAVKLGADEGLAEKLRERVTILDAEAA